MTMPQRPRVALHPPKRPPRAQMRELEARFWEAAANAALAAQERWAADAGPGFGGAGDTAGAESDPAAALLGDREALGAALSAAAEAHAAHIDALEDRLATAETRGAAALVRGPAARGQHCVRMRQPHEAQRCAPCAAAWRCMGPVLTPCVRQGRAASAEACAASGWTAALLACVRAGPGPCGNTGPAAEGTRARAQMAERQAATEQGHRQRLAEAVALVQRMASALDALLTPRSATASAT